MQCNTIDMNSKIRKVVTSQRGVKRMRLVRSTEQGASPESMVLFLKKKKNEG